MTLVTEALVLAAVGGVTTLLALFLQQYIHFRRLELAIPGPASLPLLGNTLDFVNVTPDTALKTIRRLVGGRSELTRFSLMNHLVVFVNDAEAIDCVARRPEFQTKARFVYHLLDDPRSLLQLGGAEWRARRKALEPGFHKKVLDSYMDIFHGEAKGFADSLAVGEPVDVAGPLREATSRNFLRTSGRPDLEGDVKPFVDFFQTFLFAVNRRAFNPLLWSKRLFEMTPLGRNVAKMREALHDLIREGLAAKHAEVKQPGGKGRQSGRARKTLTDILADLHDKGEILEDDVVDDLKTFFGANVETTVATVSWALKLLSMHPEVQERLFAEVTAVLGDRDVTVEDLPKMKYLDCVIKETMRMFPPLPFVGRQCVRETALCGHVLPANSSVMLNILAVHWDPRHWPEPHVFEPGRFLPEHSRGRPRGAHIPFSVGSRNCIGGKYAMMVVATLLAATVRAHRVLPVGDHEDVQSLVDNMAFDLTSRLVGGIKVVFQPRGSDSGGPAGRARRAARAIGA
ncbi:probable cytochrome P450 4ac1 [Thrips palmi]|uniref:Probable cytochrome P450 4ac1 n=1 Tax=Thrips palmi TaxID=161013 RepID=A0A6P8Z5P5_THRPL|nr:probable cytochrome P450 4ac1 [Thrips palmi]